MADANEIISNEILKLREEYIKKYNLNKYEDINQGYCSYFSKELKKRLNKEDINAEIIDSDSLKLIPEDKDLSPWSEKEILRRGFRLFTSPSLREISRFYLGYHVWVYCKDTNKHYDSESPNGEEYLFNLGLYRKRITECLSGVKLR